MAVGLRVRDPVTGVVLITLDTHLTKVLGFFNTGTADGSIADGSLANGTPFFAPLPADGSSGKQTPTFVITSSGMSWSWPGNPPANARVAVDVTYGFWT